MTVSKPSTTKSSKTASKTTKTASKAKKATKPAPAAAAEVVQNTPVEVAQPVSAVAPDSTTIESTLTTALAGLESAILEMTTSLNKLKADYKTVKAQVLREARSMDKVNAKRNKNKGSRAPSGFVKPTPISKDLAKFLGVPEDTKMARTDVTKKITAYVKEHNLQAPDNGRQINPDKKLTTLLGCKSGDNVTYFNLQKYMKPHFIKSDA